MLLPGRGAAGLRALWRRQGHDPCRHADPGGRAGRLFGDGELHAFSDCDADTLASAASAHAATTLSADEHARLYPAYLDAGAHLDVPPDDHHRADADPAPFADVAALTYQYPAPFADVAADTGADRHAGSHPSTANHRSASGDADAGELVSG